MRKAIIITSLIGSLLIILSSFQVGHALTMLLLAGVIPGTELVVSPTQALVLSCLLFGFVLARLTVAASLYLLPKKATR